MIGGNVAGERLTLVLSARLVPLTVMILQGLRGLRPNTPPRGRARNQHSALTHNR